MGHNSLLRSLMAIASDWRLKWKTWQSAGVLAGGSACGWNGIGRELACYNSWLRKINVEPGEGSSALKEGKGSGAEQTRSTGQSFKRADRSQRRWWKQRNKRPCPSVRKAQDHVGGGTETDRAGARHELGKMESCSASKVSGIGPRFPHFHSQIFRFHPGFRIDSVRGTV